MIGPLQSAPPHTFSAGPFGQLEVTARRRGRLGLWQDNHVPGDETADGDLSNGQVFLQKTTGWSQFFLQAGVYCFLRWRRRTSLPPPP